MNLPGNEAPAEGSQNNDLLQTNPATDYFAPIDTYKDTVIELVPALSRAALDNCSMFPVDALALGYFLENYPKEVTALEVGAFVGVSAFFLASHPKVSNVISVDPNLVIAEELTANSNIWQRKIDLNALGEVRALEIARRTLEQFPKQRQKISFHEGVVGTKQVGARGKTIEELESVQVPEIPETEENGMIAIVDGLHTREGVCRDLQAVFERNPQAIVFLDDCRHRWGPLVQAGAVEFMEHAQQEYRFKMIGDLAAGLASSNFGILYRASEEREVSSTLTAVGDMFSERLDPIRLLNREEELIVLVNETKQELQQARDRASESEREKQEFEKQNSRLERDIEHLRNHYASQRYKVADAVVGSVLKAPAAEKLKGLLR